MNSKNSVLMFASIITSLLIIPSLAFIWEFEPNKIEKQLKQNKTLLVLHYIPYGETYKNFKSTFKEIDLAIQKQNNKNIIVGQIDCEEYETYCEKQGIHNFPSFLIIQPNSNKIEIQTLETKEVKEKLNQINVEIEDINPINVITITSENKYEIDNGPILIKFYAPWCGHCRELKPIWENVSRNSKLRIGEVDCDEEGQICSKYSIMSYPTIIYISRTQDSKEIAEIYQGERSYDDIMRYIESKTNKMRNEL